MTSERHVTQGVGSLAKQTLKLGVTSADAPRSALEPLLQYAPLLTRAVVVLTHHHDCRFLSLLVAFQPNERHSCLQQTQEDLTYFSIADLTSLSFTSYSNNIFRHAWSLYCGSSSFTIHAFFLSFLSKTISLRISQLYSCPGVVGCVYTIGNLNEGESLHELAWFMTLWALSRPGIYGVKYQVTAWDLWL